MRRLKHIAVALPLLLIVAASSREAHEEWSARQGVEKTSRAMFACQPMVEKSASNELVRQSKNQI